MKNGAKRLLSLLLALVMACSLAVMPAAAAEDGNGDAGDTPQCSVTLTSPGPYEYGITANKILEQLKPANGNGTISSFTVNVGNNTYRYDTNNSSSSLLQAGNYTVTEVSIASGSQAVTYKVENPLTFTITLATLTFDTESGAYLKYGYWAEIFADDDNNTESGLKNCLPEFYTAYLRDGTPVYFKANWSQGAGNPEFEPKGYDDGKWYSFTASLTWDSESNSSSIDKDSLNLNSINNLAPKGYVRVYPVVGVQTLNPSSNTVSAAAVAVPEPPETVTVAYISTLLGLPTRASVKYLHEKTQAVAAAGLLDDEVSELEQKIEEAYQAALEYQYSEDAEVVIHSVMSTSTFSARQTEPDPYNITGWKIGDLTGDAALLAKIKAEADAIANGTESYGTVTLTPVYAQTGNNSVPNWATLREVPVFTLNISKSNNVPNIEVSAPNKITYGENLDNPKIKVNGGEPQEVTNANGNFSIDDDRTITCKYEGVNGTTYGPSVTKPTDAGQYRVVATLEGVGKWSSSVFTIDKYELGQDNFTGIICKEKVYDGTTNATLDTSKAKLTGLPVEGDADKITFTASGYFADEMTTSEQGNPMADLNTGKNVGENKKVAISDIILSGAAAKNYDIPDLFVTKNLHGHSYQEGTFLIEGKITPRPLTVSDNNLAVIRAQGDLAGVWTVTGELTLGNVISSEIALDLSSVTVSCNDNNVGNNKTVTLSGIKVTGSGKDEMDNYSLSGTGLAKAPNANTYIYTFSKAVITSDSIPTLGTDFTVNTTSVTYDGTDHEAKYTKINDSLGKETVTYAKRNADGSYAAASDKAPKDAGTYAVYVSFDAGNGFAAVENIPAGAITIKKATETATASIDAVPAATTKTVFLSELKLMVEDEELVFDGLKLKDISNATPTGGLQSVTGSAGQGYFTVETKPVEGEPTDGSCIIKLESDNYETITVTLTVTIDKDAISIIPTLTVNSGPFYGDTRLSEIFQVGGTATRNGNKVEGTFELAEPTKKYAPGTYTDELIEVKFTESDSTEPGTEPVVSAVASFSILESGSGGDFSGNSEVWFTIYANSPKNNNEDALLAFVRAQKPTHKVDGKSYTAVWNFDNSNSFLRQGYASNTWYNFTATLKDSSVRPKAHVRVVSVNATPALATSAKALNLTDNMTPADLGLPDTLSVTYAPSSTPDYPSENFTQFSDTWLITGWEMDGQDLTITNLKAKADARPGKDVTVTLTPVYTARDWATVTGSAPTFRLTISGKQLVTVTWAGANPSSITYGETVTLSTELNISGAAIDNPEWRYDYYEKDGKTPLPKDPTEEIIDAGTYYVNAVLVGDDEHTGESGLKRFTINPKPLSSEGIAVERINESETLTYTGQPHTPEYTVTDGDTTLEEGKDYTVTYSNNINATSSEESATVTFTGKGNYSGTHSEYFTIAQLALTAEQTLTVTGATGADGAAKVGDVLTASLKGVDSSELDWTWTVGGSAVPGSNTPSYQVKPEDSNKTITVTATAKADGNYSGETDTAEIEVEKYTVTGTVSITVDDANTDTLGDGGKIVVGTVLTAAANVTPDAAKNDGTWKWTVDGVEVTDGVDENKYTVAANSDGKKIKAIFTPSSNYDGTIESAEIEVGEALLTGTVAIDSSNGTVVGCKLSASVTPALTEGTEITYTWLRDGEEIASGNTYTITTDDRGKTISVKVTAEGRTGELVSGGVSVLATVPGKPGITVTPGNGTLTISWSAPSDNGGAPITGYKLAITPILDEITLAASVTTHTQSNLTNGTKYTVIVKAVNSEGDGEAATVTGIPSSGGGGGGGGGGGASTPVTPVNPTPGEDEDTDEYLITNLTGEDGSDIIIVQNLSNGSVGSTTTDPSGKTIILVDLPANVGESGISGEAVRLPIREAYANKDLTNAPTVTLNSMDVNGIKVRIPIVNNSINVVAVRVNPNGSEELIKNTLPTKDGIMLRMDCWNIIKLYDNSKYFTDTQDHWAADAVSFASSRELFNGTGDGTFSPDAAMTRGMLVTVLARYKDVDTSGGATWYDKGAAWAVANGLSDGTDLGGNITREQLATIMYRFAQFEGKLSGTGASLAGYTDAGSVSSWAADAMSWAVSVGLINGITPTTLDPQGSATRAQVATILMRYMKLFAL